MAGQAETKYAEAFAHEVAEVLRSAPQSAAARIEVYHDADAQTPAVRVRITRVRYELLMPAPGAIFALFCNGTWLGGISHRFGQVDPRQVALALLDRMSQSLAR
ncbi:hypothetical protein QTQ03_29425 [Micromonospora sp. WMMA1363]|uniref:hypothetical protein n=1 Tax=Micromonospora sp. WMMA1363 TaxID=3053985 RepID=UPI00259CDE98|nr:hypothetical protein [Micromonospora sp. WMMA1363]MDM4723501.1 hypothetical protein [Micromonospora sp. WMMA1363]